MIRKCKTKKNLDIFKAIGLVLLALFTGKPLIVKAKDSVKK